jgi:hypothetical protein
VLNELAREPRVIGPDALWVYQPALPLQGLSILSLGMRFQFPINTLALIQRLRPTRLLLDSVTLQDLRRRAGNSDPPFHVKVLRRIDLGFGVYDDVVVVPGKSP